MSERLETAHRWLLPLTVAVYLLAAATPSTTGTSADRAQDFKTAGVHVGLAVHGHYSHGHYGHYGHGHHHHFYRPYRYYWGYYPYRHFYPRVYYHGYYGVPRYASRFGALDLNVRPKKTTQVYVDGNYVGLTGDFDGWPEHLWLPAGTGSHELIFYNPGHETIVRHVEVQPGVVIKIREEMRPGESIPPEELTTAKPKAQPPIDRDPRGYATPPARRGTEAASPTAGLDARRSARLKLMVAPADASVYLDGRFLGIAGEIGERRSGVPVDPGEHLLEIVRPGYDGRELSFDADPSGEVDLEVELRPRSAD